MNISGIILICWTGFFILDFLIDWLLDVLNINTIIKNRQTVPSAFSGVIEEDTYNRCVSYSLRRAYFGLFTSIQGRIIMILVLAFHAAGSLDSLIARWTLPVYWHGLIFLAAAYLISGLVGLPASLYSKFIIEEEFGFNTSSITAFFGDVLKGLIVSVLLLMALLAGLYAARLLIGQYWWLAAWGFVTAFQFILTILYPLIIAPLFNKFSALPEGELGERLNALAERCNFKVRGIFVMDGSRRSRHSNAYFTGIGRTRRIVIFDTLIESLKTDELEAILAHEIGHWKHGHIRQRLLLGVLVNFAFFAIAGWAVEWIPLFQTFGFNNPSLHGIIFLAAFFTGPVTSFISPLVNNLSRKHEYQADRFAVKQTGTDPMRRALLELGRGNLSNLTPHPAYSFWHYSHPAPAERLEALGRETDKS